MTLSIILPLIWKCPDPRCRRVYTNDPTRRLCWGPMVLRPSPGERPRWLPVWSRCWSPFSRWSQSSWSSSRPPSSSPRPSALGGVWKTRIYVIINTLAFYLKCWTNLEISSLWPLSSLLGWGTTSPTLCRGRLNARFCSLLGISGSVLDPGRVAVVLADAFVPGAPADMPGSLP